MKYKVILHDPDCGLKTIESIWLESLEDVERTGETGLKFYGGTHYTVEKQEEGSK